MAAAPAAALELGDLTVHSKLGQPLRASIAYALAPNEELSDLCVAASAGAAVNGMPGIGRTTVSVGNGTILLTGDTAIREPMLGTRITINCSYTPHLVRDYMLFVDPRGVETAAPVAATVPASTPVARESSAAQRRAGTPARREPVAGGARYQVQPGDSLSQIVQRIENRSVGLWPAVNAIFDANPHAFVGNDPNRLKAGTWLDIPSFDGTTPVVAATTTAPPVEAAVSPTEATVYEPPVLETTPAVEESTAPVVEEVTATVEASAPPTDVSPVDEISAAYVPEMTDEAVVESDLSALRPGDVVAIPEPSTSEARNTIPTTIVSTGSQDSSTSMLAAMVGAGLALIAGLVIFGRRIRDRFGSTPIGPAAPQRRASDRDETIEAQSGIDFDLDDDSPTDENPILDANLFDGQGLSEGTNADIGQDFGFARTTNLDLELPFEPEQPISVDSETDIIPPMRSAISSILESEVLPEDDDYDMSVIVDATKMPQPEDVTERDLHAVAIDDGDDIEDDEEYTINREADFDILEKDYEDELTATQALNQEIARAAEELAASFDKSDAGDEDETTSLPAGEDIDHDDMTAEFDVTAELPLAENDETVEMPRKDADTKAG